MVEAKDNMAEYIDAQFEPFFVKGLQEFVRIPNLTPMVDPDYATNGLVQKAMECVDKNIQSLDIKGLKRTVIQPAGMNPMVVYVVEPSEGATKNVMLYGHLDKQPYGPGWEEGLSPTDPIIRGEFMYGRGSADDGYSAFACMLAVKSIQEAGGRLQELFLPLKVKKSLVLHLSSLYLRRLSLLLASLMPCSVWIRVLSTTINSGLPHH